MVTGMNRHFEGVTADTDLGFTGLRDDLARLDAKFDRLESKIDAHFNFQYLLMAVLGILVLFGDPIRAAVGL